MLPVFTRATNATVTIAPGAGSTLIAPTNAGNAITSLGGLIGIATDTPTSGGIVLTRRGGQLFAEGAARTVKTVVFGGGTQTHRLGGRSEFDNTFALNISNAELGNQTRLPRSRSMIRPRRCRSATRPPQQQIVFPQLPPAVNLSFGNQSIPNFVPGAGSEIQQLTFTNIGAVDPLASFKLTFGQRGTNPDDDRHRLLPGPTRSRAAFKWP